MGFSGRGQSLQACRTACCSRLLDWNKQQAAETNPDILNQLRTQLTATDRQIDRLVYELCGLSEEEVAIVEGRE